VPPPTAGASPAQSAAGPPPGDPLGPDLFIAIRGGSVADVNAVLAHGARTEATNWLGITPLMWAAFLGNQPACQSLLKAGASINGPSHYGTALSFAEMSGNTSVVAFLLDHGAKITRDRIDEITPLMTASSSGHLAVIGLLLKHGADVNASDADGMTALMFAALRGETAAARLLLNAGAKVNVADSQGMTPLMYAAESGYPQCAALLISRHSAVNLKDHSGSTALHLAAQYSSDPRVISLLLNAGADPHLKNAKGQTASEIALARKTQMKLALKGDGGTPAPGQAGLLAHRARAAANRGLPLIERSTRIFSQQATCVSCHHQGLGLMATGLAQARGFRYDKQLAAAQLNLIMMGDEEHKNDTLGVLPHPEMYRHIPTVDMGEFTTGSSYLYSGLLAHRTKPTETLAANVVILASQQFPSGQWGFFVRREPIQSSAFTTTALTVRLLKAYMPKQRAAETAERIARARAWIEATPAITACRPLIIVISAVSGFS
ncbi:MAG: ankyrin repeat domain-containing protein, partial [Chloroflexi bacterium]|nr:ankyrin repeat domain-containing protein [Chloroflexota bacterium]